MAEIHGMGSCGICSKPIQDEKTGIPSAIRHLQGHQLAHKSCFYAHEAEKATPEYRIRQAEEWVAKAESSLIAAQAELEAARLDLGGMNG